MNNFRSALFVILASLPFTSQADDSWNITFNETNPREAIEMLGQIFKLEAVNPSASCLKNNVSFSAEKSWSHSERMDLINEVARRAGCEAVIYEGNSFVVQESILGA